MLTELENKTYIDVLVAEVIHSPIKFKVSIPAHNWLKKCGCPENREN